MNLSSPSSSTQKEYTQKLSPANIATIIIEFGVFCHYYLTKVAEHIASEGAMLKGVSTVRINKKRVLMPSAETAWHRKELSHSFS